MQGISVSVRREAVNPLIASLHQGDNRSTRITFVIPRRQGDVDLGTLKWRLEIVNAVGLQTFYTPTERTVDDDTVSFYWLPEAKSTTAEVGIVHVQLYCYDTDKNKPVWQSALYHIEVMERAEGEIPPEEAAALSELQQLIVYVGGELPGVVAAGQLAKEAYQHPPVIGENGNWLIWDWETWAYVDTGKPSQGEGSGGGNVTSVNGKTGAVVLSAKDVGALAEDRLPEAVDDALAQAKASGEFDGPQGPKGETGETGPQGPKGVNGVSPIVFIMDIDGGHRVTITDEYAAKNFDVMDGKDGVDGSTPVKGVDYYTDADRADIVAEVIAALPVYNGEVADT